MLHRDYLSGNLEPTTFLYRGQGAISELQSRLAGFPVLLIANNSDLMLGRTIELDLLMRIKASCT